MAPVRVTVARRTITAMMEKDRGRMETGLKIQMEETVPIPEMTMI